ncbi:hypothetical protein OXPF_26320 [Oxobacter pfennigii]|uniref:DNA-binding protein n=1 Tax=Oxobacter pfennigii TaxID=36849 RepID=A0A0P9AEN1_9CLOT|nr:hypothetical protein [Oxobacter pfennigii]KPU43772.1 hypothetical protein OXPF_26320 [Oxobacter pfennigii]
MGKIKYTLMTVLFYVLLTNSAYAEGISSNDLIDKAKEYDGKEVIYTGEVIGDVMKRGDYAWINVFDGNNSIGLWIPYSDGQKISIAGSYSHKGDIVRARGIFNRACSQHGGEPDIHIERLEILEKGYKNARVINTSKKYIASALLVMSLGLTIFIYKRHL